MLNEINNNVEMFQKSQLENLVKNIQDNGSLYEIKLGIKNFNLFPKKLIKSRLVNTLKIPKSETYNINVDIENNMIVLQDKKFDDNLIVFCELTHQGVQSVNFYNSLINTVKPNLILLEQEPYENYKSTENSLEFDSYIEDFSDINEFRNFLKENKCDRNYSLKGTDNIYNNKKELMEIESILYCALNKKVKVTLFDLNHHEYLNSLISCKENFFSEENKKSISILNNLEISAWVNSQFGKGCKNCTSFLSRSEMEWNPLSLEYIIDKKNLPNYGMGVFLKAKKIYNKIKENNKKKIIIFSSDSLTLVNKFLDFSNDPDILEKSKEFNFEDYKREFNLKNLNNEIMMDNLTSGMLLKEKINIYSNNPPFYYEKNNEDFKKLYKENFLKNFEIFYDFGDSESLKFDSDESEGNKGLMKYKDCSPYNFFSSLKEIKNTMKNGGIKI